MLELTAKRALDAWKAADDAARAAENELSRAKDAFLLRDGPPVSIELRETAALLRTRSQDLLKEALAALDPARKNSASPRSGPSPDQHPRS